MLYMFHKYLQYIIHIISLQRTCHLLNLNKILILILKSIFYKIQ